MSCAPCRAACLRRKYRERRRIARDLHDSLGQELSAAKMVADMIPLRSAESKDLAAAEVSTLIDHALKPVCAQHFNGTLRDSTNAAG
jgi:signal transduction histidine kinase